MKELVIIEPHEDFRTVFKKIVERQNWEVHISEAGSREEGLSLIQEVKADIVFFDITLRNGIEKLEIRIKTVVPECRVIVVIPFEEEIFSRWHKTDEIEDFISKDKLSENLVPIIGKYLEI